MILVTVGTDLPFDRLVRAVDDWAGETGQRDIIAQIGETEWRPKHLRWFKFFEPTEYREHFFKARAVVSHAGMGTILSALQFGKPILIMPRLATLHEHRNEHQLATARHFARAGKVTVAFDEAALRVALNGLEKLTGRQQISPYASKELITALREFTHENGAGVNRK